MSEELFLVAWKKLHVIERGYANNPLDSGGETNHGITKRVAIEEGYTGSMKDLSEQQAMSIAKRRYWDTMNLDSVSLVSEKLAVEMFDTGYNCGTSLAVSILQEGLNCFNRSNREHPDYPEVQEDGLLGSKTLSALKSYLGIRGGNGELVMLRFMNCIQGAHYNSLRRIRNKDEEFVYGWFLNRVVI